MTSSREAESALARVRRQRLRLLGVGERNDFEDQAQREARAQIVAQREPRGRCCGRRDPLPAGRRERVEQREQPRLAVRVRRVDRSTTTNVTWRHPGRVGHAARRRAFDHRPQPAAAASSAACSRCDLPAPAAPQSSTPVSSDRPAASAASAASASRLSSRDEIRERRRLRPREVEDQLLGHPPRGPGGRSGVERRLRAPLAASVVLVHRRLDVGVPQMPQADQQRRRHGQRHQHARRSRTARRTRAARRSPRADAARCDRRRGTARARSFRAVARCRTRRATAKKPGQPCHSRIAAMIAEQEAEAESHIRDEHEEAGQDANRQRVLRPATDSAIA